MPVLKIFTKLFLLPFLLVCSSFVQQLKRETISVTRFGLISAIRQNFTSQWQIFDSLFLFGQMLSLLWQIWYIIGLIFIVANGQILKNNLNILSDWWKAIRRNIVLLKKQKKSWFVFLSSPGDVLLISTYIRTYHAFITKKCWSNYEVLQRLCKNYHDMLLLNASMSRLTLNAPKPILIHEALCA